MGTRALPVLLALLALANATIFEFHAHSWQVHHQKFLELDRRESVLLTTEKTFSTQLNNLLKDKAAVELHLIEIHGIKLKLPTPILRGFIDTTLTRDEIIERANKDDSPIALHFLLRVESIPERKFVSENLDGQTSCQNGGFLLPNATCVCPNFFKGQDCSFPICMNNGIIDSHFLRCSCPPGFQSERCESRSCVTGVESAVDTSKNTLYLVVNTKNTMAFDVGQLIGTVPQAVNTINKTLPNYFENFIVTAYVLRNGQAVYMNTAFYSNSDAFATGLTGLTVTTGDKTQPHLTAMEQTVSMYGTQHARAQMFIFADTDTSDFGPPSNSQSSYSQQVTTLQALLAWRIKPAFVMTYWQGKKLFDETSAAFKALAWMIDAAHGDLITVDKLSVEQDYIYEDLIGLHVNVENVVVQRQLPKEIPVVLPQDPTVYVNLYNAAGELSGLQGDSWNILRAAYTFGTIKVYKIDTGTYTSVQHSEATPVGIRVWVQSPVTVLSAYATNKDMDNGGISPVAGMPVYLNAIATPITAPTSSVFVDTTDQNIAGSEVQFTPRVGCTLTGQADYGAFNCTPGPFSNQVTFTIGTTTMKRTMPNYCFTNGAVQTYLQCQNGGTPSSDKTKCTCPKNWGGNVCQTPTCYNEGTVNPFPGNGQPACLCPAGYHGDFCNILTCSKSEQFDAVPSTRSFAFAIRNSFSLSHLQGYLSSLATSVLSKAPQGYYNEFILTTFNAPKQTNYTLNTMKYADAKSFRDAVTDAQFGYSNSNKFPILEALQSTIQAMTNQRSAIYLLVDVKITATQVLAQEDIKKMAIEKGTRINIIVAAPYQQQEMCLDQRSISDLQNLAFSTGGVIFNFCRQDTDLTNDFLFLASYTTVFDYQMELVDMKIADCTQSVSLSFANLQGAQNFTIIVNSAAQTGFTASLSDSKSTTPLTPSANAAMIEAFDASSVKGTLTAKVGGTGTGSCIVLLLERSPFQAHLGFVPEPDYDMKNVSPQLGAASYPVAHLTSSDQTPVVINGVANEQSIYSSTGMSRQSTCSYELYFPAPFACTTPNEEILFKLTATVGGNQYDRLLRSYCRLDVQNCLNGGTWNGTMSQCMCQMNYGGKNCEIKSCKNGADFNNGVCICQPKYVGEFCEYGTCDAWDFVATHDPRFTQFRTAIIAVEMTDASKAMVQAISDNAVQIVSRLFNIDPGFQYGLVTYDSNAVRSRLFTSDYTVLYNALADLANQELTPFKNLVKSYEAIEAMHSMGTEPMARNPALLMLFISSASDYPLAIHVTDRRMKEGTQLNVFYPLSQGPYTYDPDSNGIKYLYRMSYQSEGRFYPMNVSNIKQVPQILDSVMNELDLVADTLQPDCSKGVNINFNVESVATELAIELVTDGAPKAEVRITDGKKDLVKLTNYVHDDGVVLFLFNPTQATLPGNWNVTVTNPGRCQIQARVKSPLRVNLGFSMSPSNDFPESQPYAAFGKNHSTFIAGQIPQLAVNSTTQLISADIYTKDYETGLTTYVSSQRFGTRTRVGCAYQFISPLVDFSSTITHHVIIAAEGTDDSGYKFQRLNIFSYQSDLLKDECQNGGSRNADTGVCDCTAGWEGSLCSLPVCYNGGTRAGTVCVCKLSYYGTHCEIGLTA